MPTGSSEFSIYFSKPQNLKGSEEQLCSTTVHQGVKAISHSYQKVGRMNEESKGLPAVGWV